MPPATPPEIPQEPPTTQKAPDELTAQIRQNKPRTKRTGRTKEHYQRQKATCYTYFRINTDEQKKMRSAQYTFFDFVNDSFHFSRTKKDLTIRALEALKEKPMDFTELAQKLGAKKSTLYLLLTALHRSGLVDRPTKREPYRLSTNFSSMLREYSYWWENWVRIK
jgi:predicted transcriptional regulator